MKKIIILLFIGTILFSTALFSQSRRWKRTRYEVVGGLGISAFMGDLGGGSGSSHFVGDFNFTSQRPLISAGMRYKVLEELAVKSTLTYGVFSGSDAKSSETYRQSRNLSFSSQLLEFAIQGEYSIIKEPSSHRYSLRRRKRKFSLKNFRINTYVFAGIAGFWFNPKGLDDGPGGTDKWVSLQPLGTEGQGLMEGRDTYSRIQVAFPFGLGLKYPITRQISIGVEFGARYTLSDYLDDVSTSYVDNAWLAKNDPLAARMADRSTDDVTFGAGDQRGSSQYNDFYFFSMVTIAYKLRTGRNGLPKF